MHMLMPLCICVPAMLTLAFVGVLDPPTLANGGMTAFYYRILNVPRQTSLYFQVFLSALL